MSEETKTVIQAFELPIHRVEGVGKGDLDGWKLIRECWEHSTLLANWCVHQLVKHDVVRDYEMTKLPKRPEINGEKLKGLYGLAQEMGIACAKRGCLQAGEGHWWHGAAQSISNICRDVAAKYDKERFDVIWRRCKALCTYKYPYPWPVNAQSWKEAGFDQSGKPYVIITMPGGMVKITLRGGKEFGRQLGLFKQVVEGGLPKKQLIIRQQGSSLSCHRPTVQDGGKTCRAMCKMVAEVPVREKEGNRVLVLVTDPKAFWIAEIDNRQAWVLNADHMHRGIKRHQRHLAVLQRMSQDAKMESRTTVRTPSRWPKQQQEAWAKMSNEDQMRACKNKASKQLDRLDRLAEKDHRRIASWCHETAAHLVGFCIRQKVGEVFYLDRDKGFIDKFPWHDLHNKLAHKLKMAGIDLYSESQANANSLSKLSVDEPVTYEERVRCLRLAAMKLSATKKIAATRKRRGSHPSVEKLTEKS